MMKKSNLLNPFSIKLLACFFMVIDHIAMIFLPPAHALYVPLRIIGRVSAPIFFYTLAEGLKKTSNRRLYLYRLLVAATIMMAGNALIALLGASSLENPPTVLQPNIFIHMFLIALGIDKLETIMFTNPFRTIRSVAISAAAFIAVILLPGYKWLAISSVLTFYIIEKQWLRDIVYIFLSLLICILTQQYIQTFMVLSILFITNCSREKPKRSWKWFFYVFYPLHLWLLYGISIII